MNYHLKFLLLVVLRTLSWVIIINTTVDKFTIRQIVSIVTRNHFRKTWMRPNKIHLGPVYSYLIITPIRNSRFYSRFQNLGSSENLIFRKKNTPTTTSEVLLVHNWHSRTTVILAHSRHCVLRYFPARVCSVNLRLLTHTTPLFLLFLF